MMTRPHVRNSLAASLGARPGWSATDQPAADLLQMTCEKNNEHHLHVFHYFFGYISITIVKTTTVFNP